MRVLLSSLVALGLCSVTVPVRSAEPLTQVAVDRIVVRVVGRIITQSDIRNARLLKLVDESSSEEAARRGLENRLLIQNEMARAAPVPAPADGDLTSRRAEWEQSLGAASVPKLLAECGLADHDIQDWLREDIRIRAYLRRQFGMLPEAERGRAMSEWLARLRQRADLR